MKRLSTLLIVFLTAVTLYSQESGVAPDSIIYITPEDEVLLRDREAKYLIKLGSDAAVEFKLSKAWSLEFEIGPDNFGVNIPDISFGLGTRYYYQMAKRIREGKQANNFSGHYFSAMLGQGFNFGNPQFDPGTDATALTLGWGTQQRYLQREYFDFGVFLDINKISAPGISTVRNSFTLLTESNYGFVFGKKHDLNDENFCPVIKCYQDRKSALKINRNNFFQLSMDQLNGGDTYWFLRMRPRVGYEFKLGNSAFSIDQTIGSSLSFSNYFLDLARPSIKLTSFELQRAVLTYEFSPRFYYRMMKKILAGEQGNNLSGSYTYLKFTHDETYNRVRASWTRKGSVWIGIGRQTTITGRLYFDAKLGIGPEIYNSETSKGIDSITGELDFVIGYLF